MIQTRNLLREHPAPHDTRPLRLSLPAGRQAIRVACQALGLALLLVLALPARAQARPDPSLAPPYQQTSIAEQERALEDLPTNDPAEKERQLRVYNTARQKSMVSDANKLLKLARELNDEVTRANPDSLTPAQLRKVAQIEKLARSVKEKMGSSGQGGAAFPPAFSPQLR